MTITYAALSLYPMHDRERILQEWLVQFAWEVFSTPLEDSDEE